MGWELLSPSFLFFQAEDGIRDHCVTGVQTCALPIWSGIPPEHTAHTLVAVWNDLDQAERVIRRHRHELAAVITEPVMANKGFVPPEPGYLQGLERICRENDVLFILDEVITGFRMAPGGAQQVYGLRPDLSTFAKAMANGAPLGAFGAGGRSWRSWKAA